MISDISGKSETYFAMLSILFAFMSPMFMTAKHVFIRKYREKYNPLDMVIDGLILENFLYLITNI